MKAFLYSLGIHPLFLVSLVFFTFHKGWITNNFGVHELKILAFSLRLPKNQSVENDRTPCK